MLPSCSLGRVLAASVLAERREKVNARVGLELPDDDVHGR